jgi:hypothetical protein
MIQDCDNLNSGGFCVSSVHGPVAGGGRGLPKVLTWACHALLFYALWAAHP